MRHLHAGLLLVALVGGACQTTNYPPTTTVIPGGTLTTPTPVPNPAASEVVEFRVIGDIGQSTAAIRFSDSVNGVTILASASLPYLARVTLTDPNPFLSIFATATPVVSIPYTSAGVLQCQIVVNGQVFREDFATGYTVLSVSAEGTWHR